MEYYFCSQACFEHIRPSNNWWSMRMNDEAEAPNLWPPNVKRWSTGKDPHAGKGRRQEEKGTTEDEMARWHHQLSGHEFGQPRGVDVGQGSLACCSHGVARNQTWLSKWTDWEQIKLKPCLTILSFCPTKKKSSLFIWDTELAYWFK